MIQEGIKKANIFGYSMGGYVGLHLSKNYPGLVNKIFTLGTKFDWTPESSAREVKMLNPEKIEEKVPQFANLLKERHYPIEWKAVLRKTADMMHRLGNGEGLSPDQFSEIRHDVTISVGEEDNMVSIEESKVVSDQLNNGVFKTFASFEHPIEKVNQLELVNNLIEFFE